MENLVLKNLFSISLAVCSLAACTDTDEPATDESVSYLFSTGTAPGSERFMVKAGNLCLAAPVSGYGPITQEVCNGSHQRFFWTVERDEAADPSGQNRLFKIKNAGRCFDVVGESTQSGADVWALPCAPDRQVKLNQAFIFERVPAGAPNFGFVVGEYKIVSRLNQQLCLDIRGGTTAPGSVLQQYTCKAPTEPSINNQRFLARIRQSHATYDCAGPAEVRSRNNNDVVPVGSIMHFPADGDMTITCGNTTYRSSCWFTTTEIDHGSRPVSGGSVLNRIRVSCFE